MKIEDTRYDDQVRHLLGEAPPGSGILYQIEQRKGRLPPTQTGRPGRRSPPPKKQRRARTKPRPAQPSQPRLPSQHTGAGSAHVVAKSPIPDALDHIYEPAVAWMRENSRESVLVIEEEISYGFQRNFFALRRFAFFCALVRSLPKHGRRICTCNLRGQSPSITSPISIPWPP